MHPPTRITLSLLAALVIAPASAQTRCDWREAAWPEDRAAITTGLDTARDLATRFTPANAGSHAARGLLDRAMAPRALGDIAGQWQVRSIQLHDDFAYEYPYFKARIGRERCGWTVAKTTGSQRRNGVLLGTAGEQHALAFLGGSTVNDDPVRAYSRIADPNAQVAAESDSTGRLVRFGRRELLLILDVEQGRGGFELYHLKR